MESTTSPQPADLKSLANQYSKFFKEVRKRLIVSLIVFLLSTLAGFVLYERIIKYLIGILSLDGLNIVFTSPFQFISLALSTGVACAVVITFPLVLFQLFSFLKPALKNSEFKILLKILPFALILFLLGMAFGFFIMKWQIAIFLERSTSLGIGNVLDISKLLKTVIITSLLMGVGFQFPIILMLLLKLNLISRQRLAKSRLWVYLGSFFFAILLPADSIVADVILALPLITLFEIILLVSKVKRKTS